MTRTQKLWIGAALGGLLALVALTHYWMVRQCESTCAAFGEDSVTRGRDRICLCRNEDGLLYDPRSRSDR